MPLVSVFMYVQYAIWMILVKKAQEDFFRWFWDFLKEEKVFLPVFLLGSFILFFFICSVLGFSIYICAICHMGDSCEKKPRRFFEMVLRFSEKRISFSKCNLYFQSVLICHALIRENITKMSHTQRWLYCNSTFQC